MPVATALRMSRSRATLFAFAVAFVGALTTSRASLAEDARAPATTDVDLNDRTEVNVLARPTPPEPETPATTWYGYQTLIADAAVLPLGLLGTQIKPGSSDLGGVFLGAGYFGGAPAIHFAHGRWRTGLLSLGIRVVTVIAGGLIGSQLAAPQYDGSSPGERPLTRDQTTLYGVAIGAGVAVAVDAALLAHERVAQEPARAPQSASAFRVSPMVGVEKSGGATMGVAGSF